MKKIFTTIALIITFALLFSFLGCTPKKYDGADNKVNNQSDGIDLESQNSGSANQNGNAQTIALISKEDATKMAFKHAGVKESEITQLEVELDRDDGLLSYEIGFNKGNIEYDYDIDAVNGKILKQEKDFD